MEIKLLLVSLGALLVTTAANAEMVAAVLVADDSECQSDHMVFYNEFGFIHAEWFGGYMTEDQVYLGDFHSYGMTDVYDQGRNEAGQVWVEDFWMSKSDAAEFCYQR